MGRHKDPSGGRDRKREHFHTVFPEVWKYPPSSFWYNAAKHSDNILSQTSLMFLLSDLSVRNEEWWRILKQPCKAMFQIRRTFFKISQDFFTFIPQQIRPSQALWNAIDLLQMHTFMYMSVHLSTHSRDQYAPTPSHCQDKTSRSLTYTVTEYQSYSAESLFDSPRMFLSLSIKGL